MIRIKPGARLRLIQSTDATPVPIANGIGGILNNPDVEQYSTFPASPFDANKNFIAPQAGFFRFNTAAEIQTGGLLLVSIADARRGQQYDSAVQGAQNLSGRLDVTLYLEKGDAVQRYISLYDGTDTTVFPRANSNFYEIEYLGL